MFKIYVITPDMSFRDLRSIGSTLLLTLAIVSAASLSGRLYKENQDTKKVLAAGIMSSEVACVQPELSLIP
jgi:hypothetical protein